MSYSGNKKNTNLLQVKSCKTLFFELVYYADKQLLYVIE